MSTWLARQPKEQKLTRTEQKLLESLPEGWFNKWDLPSYPLFPRKDYFLERLRVKGYLEGSYSGYLQIFHKVKVIDCLGRKTDVD